MNKLTQASFTAARDWLAGHGRPLERALCAVFFDQGSPDAAVDALSAYQNADGGYGHRLEPDHTDDGSTVLNTSVALAIHRRLGMPSDHPQVTKAAAYLASCYDPGRLVWPIRPPVTPGAEGPPWFAAESMEALMANFGGCRINPTAEIIGYLLDHSAGGEIDGLPQALDHVMQALLGSDAELSQHDLMCAAELLRTAALPDGWRQRLHDKLIVALSAAIESDPGQWQGYAFRPTQVIDGPTHPLVGCVPEALLSADLDFEIDRVSDDGAWHPFWDWGKATPAWREAECAWTSILTERTLRVLASFGRIENYR